MDHGETAFTAGNGLWQNNLMAFGHCHAQATFEHLMDTILGDHRRLIYLDDIIVHVMTFGHEIKELRQDLACLLSSPLIKAKHLSLTCFGKYAPCLESMRPGQLLCKPSLKV